MSVGNWPHESVAPHGDRDRVLMWSLRCGAGFAASTVLFTLAAIGDLVWLDLHPTPPPPWPPGGPPPVIPMEAALAVIGALVLGVVVLTALLRGSGALGVILGMFLAASIAIQYHAGIAQAIDPSAEVLDSGGVEGFSIAYGMLAFVFFTPAALAGWGGGAIVRGALRPRRPS